ncbi:MAG: universal stress protein [Bacteroidales bacterium]|nr:MAG: universal stress protein [Bacteroidales bacterium]
MESNALRLLIPWDFSPVAENALMYAVKIGSLAPSVQVELIYVIESGGLFTKVKLTAKEATEKLKVDYSRIKETYGIEVKTTVMEGNIFHTISEHAADINADLVIMGTHGIKGVQKLTGSWALKVIAGSSVPFLVVQDSPKDKRVFEHVVMPLDFSFDEKSKLQWAIKVSVQYKSQIHIIIPNAFDAGVQKKVNYNLAFAKKHLEGYNIPYEIHSAGKGGKFQEEIVKLALDIEADLILIMTSGSLDFTDYVFGAQEQYVIANEAKIPVMCINQSM